MKNDRAVNQVRKKIAHIKRESEAGMGGGGGAAGRDDLKLLVTGSLFTIKKGKKKSTDREKKCSRQPSRKKTQKQLREEGSGH